MYALALLGLDCSSCISVDSHDPPKGWPSVPRLAQDCPDLTGLYANNDQGSPEVPLAKWILPKTTYPLERVESVEFVGPTNGSLTVRLIQGPGNADVATRELKRGSGFRCEGGRLVLPVEGIVIPPFVYSADARLARSADGQLVVEATEFGAGLAPYAPLVPVAKTSNKWHLYPLVAE